MNSIAKNIELQTLSNLFTQDKIEVDVLRLDKFHPIVSGNKWFKLQYYLQEATILQHNTIATFGGAFSNHIVATAFACKQNNFKSIGIIRGEEPKQLSHTLLAAKEYGMQLFFVDRSFYKTKQLPPAIQQQNLYTIPEGGYGNHGAKGSATILQQIDYSKYTHIICACGTGTTLAGLVETALPHQKIIGINALKGYENIVNDVKIILNESIANKAFQINNNYHFGGYAKYNDTLIKFMNELWQTQQLPTDFVYTAKLFYAVKDMINKNEFEENSKILVIHSGGLQGNYSLPNKTLLF